MKYSVEWFDGEDLRQEILVEGAHVTGVALVPDTKYGDQIDVTVVLGSKRPTATTLRISLPNTVERIAIITPSTLRADWEDETVTYQKPS